MGEIPLAGKFFLAQNGGSLEDYRDRRDNLLIISPHPDDDILGAGGTIVAASRQGRGVFSVYITDGRGSPRLDPTISDEDMAQIRENEAKAAMKVVGAAGGFFLRSKSDEILGVNRKQLIDELVSIFHLLKPAEVYLPAPYERHRIHQRCTRLIIEALRLMDAPPPVLWGYSLWGSFWGGKRRDIRDITEFIKTKIEAIRVHDSQIVYKNYCQGALGRNNSEAIFWESHEVQKATFVELFLEMTELIEKKDLTVEEFIRQDVESFIQKYLQL